MASEKRILLVEDDPDQNALYLQILSLAQYQVVAVADAETALQQLSKQQFDLLLTDWYLPCITGDALVTDVKQRYPAVKTVLMSSHHHVHETAKACNADGWFRKSDEFKRLLKVVALVLSEEIPSTS